ncbi:hypothetical protein DL96DRAFT_1720482 [Flagelloscypha sp. PMI_526]|nr:hypothetical protein DL96DRAFT_1720482 [Flagelloscypha sp. PMI_526]
MPEKACSKQQRIQVGQMPSQLSTLPNFIFTPSPTPLPPNIQIDPSSAGDDGPDEGHGMSPPAGHEPTQHSLSITEPLSQTNTEGVSEKQVSTGNLGNTQLHRQCPTSSCSTLQTTSIPAPEFVTFQLSRTVAKELIMQLKSSRVEFEANDQSGSG